MSELRETARAELARRKAITLSTTDNNAELKQAAKAELARRMQAKEEALSVARGDLSPERTLIDEVKDIPKGILS